MLGHDVRMEEVEDENIEIGVVTPGQGQRWYEINLSGFESHAGSTPMKVRNDAPLERICAVACGGQTGAGAVLNVMKPKPGEGIARFELRSGRCLRERRGQRVGVLRTKLDSARARILILCQR